MQHAIHIPIMESVESRSSTSSPKTTVESTSTQKTELSPPSSVGSTTATHGKKRKADGEEVEYTNSLAEVRTVRSRDGNTVRDHESKLTFSKNLRTKLSYAMVKVQNGWQSNTLEEVESLASSPRSTIPSTSPRFSLSAMSQTRRLQCLSTTTMPSLAPPAPIISGRKRPNPNLQLKPKQPQRTPSQNAAMEADAVETLLFMSGSPNNSGRFPSSCFSPTSQTFSAQTSPLKEQFSPFKRPTRRYEDKSVLIDRLLSDLDDDMNHELDEAVRILERYRSRRKSSLT